MTNLQLIIKRALWVREILWLGILGQPEALQKTRRSQVADERPADHTDLAGERVRAQTHRLRAHLWG